MIDEIKLRQDEAKASRATALLNDELLNEALATLERDYTQALFQTRPDDAMGREKLYLAVNVVRKIKDHLSAVVQNGVLAQHQLRDLANAPQKPFHEI